MSVASDRRPGGYTRRVIRTWCRAGGETRACAWMLGLAAAAGCTSEPADSVPSVSPVSAAVPAPASALGASIDPPEMPRPDRRRGERAARENERCIECHQEQAREWSASRHKDAYASRAFREALREEPPANTGFCRGCHAPEADPTAEPSAALAALGVGCVTCHVTDDAATVRAAGAVLLRAPSSERMPHALERSPGFSGAGACVACHEFRFPAGRGGEDAQFMQTTAREHARSPAAARSCASCHMPRRAGRRSHLFDVRDPAWLSEAVAVSASVDEAGAVVIRVAQKDAGHALPTGDLFRRLEVGAAWGPPGAERERVVQHLERRFMSSSAPPYRALVEDDRVFFEPAVVELVFQGVPTERDEIRYWVGLQRVAQVGAGDPAHAKIESEVTLAAGPVRRDGPRTDTP